MGHAGLMGRVCEAAVRRPAITHEDPGESVPSRDAASSKPRPSAIRYTVVVGVTAVQSRCSTRPTFQPVSPGATTGLLRTSAHDAA